MIDRKFYTATEVSIMLGVKQQQVHRWIRAKKLRAVWLGGGRRVRIPEAFLREFLGMPETPAPGTHTEPARILPQRPNPLVTATSSPAKVLDAMRRMGPGGSRRRGQR